MPTNGHLNLWALAGQDRSSCSVASFHKCAHLVKVEAWHGERHIKPKKKNLYPENDPIKPDMGEIRSYYKYQQQLE